MGVAPLLLGCPQQPLTRYPHRAKTHAGYHVRQLVLGVYRWVTPHGLARVVTGNGTQQIEVLRDADGQVIGETYRPRLEIELAYDAAGLAVGSRHQRRPGTSADHRKRSR